MDTLRVHLKIISFVLSQMAKRTNRQTGRRSITRPFVIEQSWRK